jgi:hypothetical protein
MLVAVGKQHAVRGDASKRDRSSTAGDTAVGRNGLGSKREN